MLCSVVWTHLITLSRECSTVLYYAHPSHHAVEIVISCAALYSSFGITIGYSAQPRIGRAAIYKPVGTLIVKSPTGLSLTFCEPQNLA
jgi:hypothetical protein